MQLNLCTSNDNEYQVQRYDASHNTIVIQDIIYKTSICLTPQAITCWAPQTIDELKADDFSPIISLDPQVILLGTGASQVFPDTEILAPCIKANLAVDIMDTATACRTFNVLSAEGRHIVAALLIA